MQSDLENQQGAVLDAKLLREGWCLHQRLEAAVELIEVPQSKDQLESWRKLVAPDNCTNFDKRLKWDRLDLDRAGWALDPPATAIPKAPAWWPLLGSIRQAGRAAATSPIKQPLDERGSKQPFVHVWRPAASWALQTLQRRCADLEPRLQLSDTAWLDLAEALLERLCTTADQALWEQFNNRRTTGQMLLAHLGVNSDGSGEVVREAYNQFVAELLSSGYGILLAEYPVLGRLLAVITELWFESSEEKLRRLADSRSTLQQHFDIAPTTRVEKIKLGLSDPHRGGRAVAILTFGKGNDRRMVVYKPKDMQVDATYQRYLQTLNKASSLEPLRYLTIVNCDGYGFMEWVEHRPSTSEQELARFYTNAGRTMAILHLLGCTDCHHENLIASADQLILIDTETLLEADHRDLISDDGDKPDAISALETSMQGSVLRSGLLPQWLIAGANRKHVVDMSALGIQPPPAEREVPGWIRLNTDGMVAGRITTVSELPTSLPVGLGSSQRLTNFVEELCRGFSAQMEEALRLRSVLLSSLDSFSGQPRRLVARATRIYFTIQRQMLEPASLRNAVSHGLKLEQLSRSFVIASDKPLNWPVFKAEVLQMEDLDIPFFEHLIDAEELPLPDGLPPIPHFMKASGLAAARCRLGELDSAEIDFQQQLIRGAIAARHLTSAMTVPVTDTVEEETTGVTPLLSADLYRSEAFRLGEELWNSAIRDRKGRPEWVGMDIGIDGESFHFGLIGKSLYSGSSGLALLFARLALASQGEASQTWRERAWTCFEDLVELADRNSNDEMLRMMRDLPFGISGSGGILLTLLLLHHSGFTQAGLLFEKLVDQLQPERLKADQSIDIVAGVSGLIGPLLLSNLPKALELALICGDRLLDLQRENGGWIVGIMGNQKPPFTGFSHGAAGIAAALAQLSQVSGERRFATGVEHAVAYERSVFDVQRGNWPDFRNTGTADEFMLTWCHGAPGILMSRLVLEASALADAHTTTEREAAHRSTLRACHLFGKNKDYPAHLCCGLLGLSSILRIEAQSHKTPLDAAIQEAESAMVGRSRTRGNYIFFNIDTGSLNLPGMYTGKAGVALALLEAADGIHWLPSVLSAGLLNMFTQAH